MLGETRRRTLLHRLGGPASSASRVRRQIPLPRRARAHEIPLATARRCRRLPFHRPREPARPGTRSMPQDLPRSPLPSRSSLPSPMSSCDTALSQSDDQRPELFSTPPPRFFHFAAKSPLRTKVGRARARDTRSRREGFRRRSVSRTGELPLSTFHWTWDVARGGASSELHVDQDSRNALSIPPNSGVRKYCSMVWRPLSMKTVAGMPG